MTNKIEEMKEIFNQKLQELSDTQNQDTDLWKRLRDAQENIVTLETEQEELKSKRPALLADKKDVTKLNKRLKEIDEEIELNKDTITGITEKRKQINNLILDARQHANSTFKKYIETILSKLRKEYMKIAPKLAEILTEYICLENLRDGDGNGSAYFKIDDINCLPNCNDEEHPLFKYQYYRVAIDNRDKVREKYSIPDFQVHHVSFSDYIN